MDESTHVNKRLEVEELLLSSCSKPQVSTEYERLLMHKSAVHHQKITSTIFDKLELTREATCGMNLIPLYCYISAGAFNHIVSKGIQLSSPNQEEVGVFFTMKSPCSLGLGSKLYAYCLYLLVCFPLFTISPPPLFLIFSVLKEMLLSIFMVQNMSMRMLAR